MKLSYPVDVWVLQPSFKPKQVKLTGYYGNYCGDDYHSSESGKTYCVTEITCTENEIIAKGEQLVKKQQADLDKKQANLDKRKENLAKAKGTLK